MRHDEAACYNIRLFKLKKKMKEDAEAGRKKQLSCLKIISLLLFFKKRVLFEILNDAYDLNGI